MVGDGALLWWLLVSRKGILERTAFSQDTLAFEYATFGCRKFFCAKGAPRIEVCQKGKFRCNRIPSGVSILHMALASLAGSSSHSPRWTLCHCVQDEHDGTENCYCNPKRHGQLGMDDVPCDRDCYSRPNQTGTRYPAGRLAKGAFSLELKQVPARVIGNRVLVHVVKRSPNRDY